MYICIYYLIFRESIKFTYCWNEHWWLLTAGVVSCLKPMALRHRHGWPTASSQLRCSSGLWVEAAGKSNSLWPELQVHGRALGNLPGPCSHHRLQGSCATHWNVAGVPPPAQIPPGTLVLKCSGIVLSPTDRLGEGFILLAQCALLLINNSRVFGVCHEHPVSLWLCIMTTYQQKPLFLCCSP